MVRLVIFTQNTMASIVATREVLKKHHDAVVAVVLASQLKGESFLDQLKVAHKLIRKSSWGFFGYKLVESKVYPLLLRAHGVMGSKAFKEGRADTIESLARKYHIPLLQSDDLSNEEFLAKIKELNPDYILCSVAQILKRKVFETLGKKLINAHGSYLPQYRGAAQYVWYLLNGDAQFGVTIHYMEAGMDTGDIIFQRKFEYSPDWSAYRLHYQIALEWGRMFNEFIEQYASGEIKAVAQLEEEASVTRMPTSEDLMLFKEKGKRLMTWHDFKTLL